MHVTAQYRQIRDYGLPITLVQCDAQGLKHT